MAAFVDEAKFTSARNLVLEAMPTTASWKTATENCHACDFEGRRKDGLRWKSETDQT